MEWLQNISMLRFAVITIQNTAIDHVAHKNISCNVCPITIVPGKRKEEKDTLVEHTHSATK